MTIRLEDTPTTNSCAGRIAFLNGIQLVAALDPGEVSILTKTFDTIVLYPGPNAPIARTQDPNVALSVSPGQAAYVSTANNQTLFQYNSPGGEEQTIYFT